MSKKRKDLFSWLTFEVFLEEEKKKKMEDYIISRGGKISENASFTVTSMEYLKTLPKEFYFKKIKHECFKHNFVSESEIENFDGKSPFHLTIRQKDYMQLDWNSVDEFEEFEEWKRKVKYLEKETSQPNHESEYFLFGSDIDSVLVSFLSLKDVLNLKLVNKSTCFLISKDFIWKSICENFIRRNSKMIQHFNKKQENSWYLFFRQRIFPVMVCSPGVQDDLGLHISRKSTKKKLKLGASKLGGNPDLPKGVSIPEDSLLALQLNLSDFKDNEFLSWIFPKKGMLYFFVQLPEIESPATEGTCIFCEDSTDLETVFNPVFEEIDDEILNFPASNFENEFEIELFETVVTPQKSVSMKESPLLFNWNEGELGTGFPFIHGINEVTGMKKVFQTILTFSGCGPEYLFYQFFMSEKSLESKKWDECKVRTKIYIY
jgi:hypothetical protein